MYLPRFTKAPPPDPGSGDWSAWTSLLASRIHDADAGPEGAMNVTTDFGFGTVSSSLIALPALSRAPIKPVWLQAEGNPGESAYQPVEL